MKTKFFAFALIVAGFISVTASGCVVRGGYGHPYHHDHYYRGY